ncbi:hypothetical protein [Mangrovicoccus ximenensis]|uniref:hypothetical protein n=1 Tax=Mangrovicoccus ximenensis TaxID=1911570 RepID=UPI0013750567|nr:hypothetical protein [Mangrovicoccus ximenensis]
MRGHRQRQERVEQRPAGRPGQAQELADAETAALAGRSLPPEQLRSLRNLWAESRAELELWIGETGVELRARG